MLVAMAQQRLVVSRSPEQICKGLLALTLPFTRKEVMCTNTIPSHRTPLVLQVASNLSGTAKY
eukprot:12401553-Prorocentrum_lima.AAC.1